MTNSDEYPENISACFLPISTKNIEFVRIRAAERIGVCKHLRTLQLYVQMIAM